jgi:cobalt-zinc-cadmium resistance protein CzcA
MTKEKLLDEVQSEFAAEFAGIGFNFSQYIQDNVEEQLSGVKGANSVKIIGRDLATLERLAEQAMREMSKVRGVADLGIFRVLGQPNLNIRVDRERAARYGLNSGDVNAIVQAALGGAVATTQLEADRQFNVTVRLPPEQRNTVDDVRNIKVGFTTPSGTNAYIPVSELTSVISATFRSNSACEDVISAARLRKRSSGSRTISSSRADIASTGRESSRSCNRPRSACRLLFRSAWS